MRNLYQVHVISRLQKAFCSLLDLFVLFGNNQCGRLREFNTTLAISSTSDSCVACFPGATAFYFRNSLKQLKHEAVLREFMLNRLVCQIQLVRSPAIDVHNLILPVVFMKAQSHTIT